MPEVQFEKIPGGSLYCGDSAAVEKLLDDLPDEERFFKLADLFRIFGDSTRLKILYALLKKELSVNDIASMLSMTQSAISHQLRVLKTNGLVKFRRDGKSIIYSLADSHVSLILSQGMDHICE
ncbi:MAG: metalloregulator ArsR/SmtB family transcription factor [Treponema sp.]|jgi:ArsR family transcriptional regulator|nr:metalloregulator ArsR/SmtB family transcription factor [Treponema sp.]